MLSVSNCRIYVSLIFVSALVSTARLNGILRFSTHNDIGFLNAHILTNCASISPIFSDYLESCRDVSRGFGAMADLVSLLKREWVVVGR